MDTNKRIYCHWTPESSPEQRHAWPRVIKGPKVGASVRSSQTTHFSDSWVIPATEKRKKKCFGNPEMGFILSLFSFPIKFAQSYHLFPPRSIWEAAGRANRRKGERSCPTPARRSSTGIYRLPGRRRWTLYFWFWLLVLSQSGMPVRFLGSYVAPIRKITNHRDSKDCLFLQTH